MNKDALPCKFPSGFSIAHIGVRPATVLAPMAGVTDTVFRRLIRNQGGCGLLMTEFTSSHGVVSTQTARKPNRNFRYLQFEPEEHPITCQLFGSDPDVLAEAAQVCESRGFDVVGGAPHPRTRRRKSRSPSFPISRSAASGGAQSAACPASEGGPSG